MAFHEMNINCYVSAIHSEFIFINRNLKIVVSLKVILGNYYFSWYQIRQYLKPSLTIFFTYIIRFTTLFLKKKNKKKY